MLTTAELARRAEVVAVCDAGWMPDLAGTTWDDTVAIGSASVLYNWCNGTAVGGVTRNPARNQRVQLTSPFTNDRSATIDRLRGLDYLGGGKTLLIESATTTVTLACQINISGCRGIYIRRVDLAPTVTSIGGDATWTPGANSVVVAAGGTGYSVGETLVWGSHPAKYVNPVATVATIGAGGALTGVTIDAVTTGVFSGTANGVGVTTTGGTGATLNIAPGANPHDAMIVTIQRNASFPLLPVITIEDCNIGSGHAGVGAVDWLSCIAAAECEQVFVINCRFVGYQTALRINSVRRFKDSGCDFQRGIGDKQITTNTASGDGSAYATAYPDKRGHSWSRFATLRNLHDAADAVNAAGRLMGLFLEHTDVSQAGTAPDTGPISRLNEFEAAYGERITYYDTLVGRLGGGTQGHYNDDTTMEIRGLSHNCILVVGTIHAISAWNGDYDVAECTLLRVGQIPPGPAFDANVGFQARKRTGTAIASTHSIRKSVTGVYQTIAGTGYVASTLVDGGGNLIVSPANGATAYAAAFPTIGATADGEGRMNYSFADDGAETQAAFRARLFAAFGGTTSGVSNPSTWATYFTMATGDIIGLTVRGATVTDDSGNAPHIDGFVVAVRVQGLGRRHPITDPVTDATRLRIDFNRPGFDQAGNAITRADYALGGVPHINTYPVTWASIGSGGTVPPRSWCCNGSGNANIYYTEAGGARGATAPTHTIGAGAPGTAGTTVSDGGVSWTAYTSGTIAGYMERVVSSDADVYMSIDMPIMGSDAITAASMTAGAYSVGGVASLAAASIPSIVNGSTLKYEIPICHIVSPPHMISNGTARFELMVNHAWAMNGQAVPCVMVRASNAAGTLFGPWLTITQPSLSQFVPITSPGAGAVEVFGGDVDTSTLAAGDCYFQYKAFPWIGDVIFDSEIDGEGSLRRDSTAYAVAKAVHRVGSNLYFVKTPGISGVGTGPTGTATLTDYTDGTVVWNYFGNSATATNSSNPQARYHFVNDPASVLKRGFACFNASGSNVGSPIVHATRAAALAAKGTASYGTALLAGNALRTYHNTAGGGLTTHDDISGGELIGLAGTHIGFGASMQSLPSGSGWCRVIADPDASAGTVIFGYTATQAIKAPPRRMWFEGWTMTDTTGALIDPASDGLAALAQPITEVWYSNITRAGAGAASNFESRVGISWLNNSVLTGGAALPATGSNRIQLAHVMGCNISGATNIKARHTFGNRISGDVLIRDAPSTWTPGRMFHMVSGDFVTGGATRNGVTIVELGIGTDPNAYLGVSINNVQVESRTTAGNEPCFRIGADLSNGDLRNVLIFGCGAAGERTNFGYNDQAATPLRTQFYIRNNVFETLNTVSSYFAHAGSTKGVGRFQNLWCVYAVGMRDNVSFEGSGSGGATFNQDTSAQMRRGRNSSGGDAATDALQIAQFVDDRSRNRLSTSGNTGGGDYRPAPGALAIGRAATQVARFDRAGAVRRTNGTGAVGAYEQNGSFGPASGTIALSGSANGTQATGGAALGTVVVMGSASGLQSTLGTGSGSILLSGSASGLQVALGTGSGTIAVFGSTSGSHTSAGAVAGAATGTISILGSATGQHATAGAAIATITLLGAGQGMHAIGGVAAGTIAAMGSAFGFFGSFVPVLGEAIGEVSLFGSAQARSPTLFMFPGFDDVPQPTIDFWLARAARVVDDSWAEADRDFARALLAAHLLTEQGFGTGAESEAARAGAAGFRVMKSGSLTLEREPAQSAGASAYATTAYGRQFAVLLRQNRGGARITASGVPVGGVDAYGQVYGLGRLPTW